MRQADPKARTDRLVLVGRPEWVDKIKAVREIAARNNEKISDILFAKGVEPYLQEHHWPPGQSQTQLDWADKPKLLPLWKTCRYGCDNLHKGEFICRQDGIPRTPEICAIRNRNSGCYRQDAEVVR